jgi:hypothetical protein
MRGGYGIGYERNFGNVTFNIIQNPPNQAVIALTAPVDMDVIPVSADNNGPMAGTSGSKAIPKVSLRAVDPNMKQAAAHFWSLSVEQEISKALVVGAEYTGSRGTNLYSISNYNRIGAGNYYLGDACDPDAGTCTSRPLNTQYSNINFRANGGESLYNGLNFKVETRNIGNSGLNLRANYTWSHALDNLSSTFTDGDNYFNLGFLDPYKPGLDWGNAEFDNRHRIAISAVWEVPFGKNTKGVLNKITSGWSFAPIITARTGSAFTIFDSTMAFAVAPRMMIDGPGAPNGTGLTATSLPNTYKYIDFDKLKVNSNWVNSKVGMSDFGPFPSNMSGRGQWRQPSRWNMDGGIYKNTKINERFQMQIRGEMYNFFNHPYLKANVADNDVASVPYVSAHYEGRRNVQLAMKLIF